MKISGSATLAAPREQVWAAFNDPAVLARTLPGCDELRQTGESSYDLTITAGVASIKGSYEGKVELDRQRPPGSFVMRASGAGTPGTISADVRVILAELEAGGTELTYEADAVVGGPVGGVGQRMLTGVAKKMAGQFFAAVDADIATGGAVEAPVAAAAVGEPAPTGEAVAGPAAPAVYRPTPPPAGAGVGALAGRDLLIGAAAGAAIALAGVLVGAAASRRRA